ncbi:thermonuclease family protein [Wukongibacter baidiensis]|uniref:thermonuclease family protein n=1 Tax=Wukongibacter baidiensis TaxID=1723361 RepID=UPI003D7F92FB
MKKLSIIIVIGLIFLFFVSNSEDNSSFESDNGTSEYVAVFKNGIQGIKSSIDKVFTAENKEGFKRSFSDLIYKAKNIITDEELKKIKQRAADLFKEINNSIWNNLVDSDYEKALVTRVVDGDTIVVVLNGIEEKVRLIGVNTPESAGKYKGNPQPYGKEASNFTKRSLLGSMVYFEKDVGDKDKYGRLLRYVWLKDPSEGKLNEDMFNAILLKEGYGNVMTIQPNVKYQQTFVNLEKEARKNKKGLWQLK